MVEVKHQFLIETIFRVLSFAFAGHIAATKSPRRNEVVSMDPRLFRFLALRECRRKTIETQ